MQKQLLLLGFSVLFSCAVQAQTRASNISADGKGTEIDVLEERRNAYQKQSISGITDRKDALLQE